jgi:hypothetical protein
VLCDLTGGETHGSVYCGTARCEKYALAKGIGPEGGALVRNYGGKVLAGVEATLEHLDSGIATLTAPPERPSAWPGAAGWGRVELLRLLQGEGLGQAVYGWPGGTMATGFHTLEGVSYLSTAHTSPTRPRTTL